MALRVGLVGFGAVGGEVARLVGEGAAGPVEIVGALVRRPERYADAAVPLVGDVAALIELRPELVVETAGHEAMRTVIPAILEAGIEVLALGVGALADETVHERLTAAARAGRTQLRALAGAIAGLDAISAAAVGEVTSVVHTVRKPPIAFLDAAEAQRVVESGEARELFRGRAREAALEFPANVNVVAAVSLAGIGLDRTEARVVADPSVSRNTHDVEIEGYFGRLALRMENIPSANPKTGRIVALSVVRALRARSESIVVGG
jgi:aspartate dehydrogenase